MSKVDTLKAYDLSDRVAPVIGACKVSGTGFSAAKRPAAFTPSRRVRHIPGRAWNIDGGVIPES
jgi:hypothetical protein